MRQTRTSPPLTIFGSSKFFAKRPTAPDRPAPTNCSRARQSLRIGACPGQGPRQHLFPLETSRQGLPTWLRGQGSHRKKAILGPARRPSDMNGRDETPQTWAEDVKELEPRRLPVLYGQPPKPMPSVDVSARTSMSSACHSQPSTPTDAQPTPTPGMPPSSASSSQEHHLCRRPSRCCSTSIPRRSSGCFGEASLQGQGEAARFQTSRPAQISAATGITQHGDPDCG